MGLPRKASTGIFDKVMVNVYDIITKEIVFTGGSLAAANYMGIPMGQLGTCLKKKCRIKKKWAVRIAKQ
jgi:hypothetical protein